MDYIEQQPRNYTIPLVRLDIYDMRSLKFYLETQSGVHSWWDIVKMNTDIVSFDVYKVLLVFAIINSIIVFTHPRYICLAEGYYL